MIKEKGVVFVESDTIKKVGKIIMIAGTIIGIIAGISVAMDAIDAFLPGAGFVPKNDDAISLYYRSAVEPAKDLFGGFVTAVFFVAGSLILGFLVCVLGTIVEELKEINLDLIPSEIPEDNSQKQAYYKTPSPGGTNHGNWICSHCGAFNPSNVSVCAKCERNRYE